MIQDSQPLFSVIIPSYHRNDLLAKCLDCLGPGRQDGMVLVAKAEQLRAESENQRTIDEAAFEISEFQFSAFPTYEVIVADDGRKSTAEAMIREQFPWAHWVQGPGTGPAGNRNSGAAVARGNWLAFTDDDCLPQPGWLAAFSTAIMNHPAVSIFEGKTVPDRPRQTLAEHAPVGSQGGNLWSCNFAILRGVFESIGGFDGQFRVCMEDSDFSLRVRQAGFSFPFIEDALVVHPWRPRKLASDGWKSNRGEMEDHLRFKRKHPDAEAMTSARLVCLGVRVFWCDIRFICETIDYKGVSFALSNLLQLLRLALLMQRVTIGGK